MLPDEEVIHINLKLGAGEQADESLLDQLTRQLRGEIQEMGAESAELAAAGTPPEGAKAVEFALLGELVVAVLPSMLPNLIGIVASWLSRGADRKIRINAQVGDRRIELEGSTKDVTGDKMPQFLQELMASLEEGKQ
jgi:hypothetical protein